MGRRRSRAAPQISGPQRHPKDLWTPKLRRARAQAFVGAQVPWNLDGFGAQKCHKDSWASNTCAPDPRCSWTLRRPKDSWSARLRVPRTQGFIDSELRGPRAVLDFQRIPRIDDRSGCVGFGRLWTAPRMLRDPKALQGLMDAELS